MCLPVAVPAHPRILAGRRFLRISPNISPHISPDRGGAETGRSDFIYTKNSAIGRSDCIYTKNSARPSWGAMRQKMAIFKVRNSVCRVQIFPGAFISYSPRGLRIVSGGAWGDNRGTMRQKMTIFKVGNSVCRDAKIGGRCDRK